MNIHTKVLQKNKYFEGPYVLLRKMDRIKIQGVLW